MAFCVCTTLPQGWPQPRHVPISSRRLATPQLLVRARLQCVKSSSNRGRGDALRKTQRIFLRLHSFLHKMM